MKVPMDAYNEALQVYKELRKTAILTAVKYYLGIDQTNERKDKYGHTENIRENAG